MKACLTICIASPEFFSSTGSVPTHLFTIFGFVARAAAVSSPLVLDGGLATVITGFFVGGDGFALRVVGRDFGRRVSWEDGSLSESQISM